MVENWVTQIISWLPELFWHIFKWNSFLVINTKFACFPSNHVPRELGRPSGDFEGHVGSPDCVIGRIWRLSDRLPTALQRLYLNVKGPKKDKLYSSGTLSECGNGVLIALTKVTQLRPPSIWDNNINSREIETV